MPIVRTYACESCGHQMRLTLTAEQWNEPAPGCPHCAAEDMQQEFKAPGIVRMSARSKATALAEQIAAEDYGVADMQVHGKEGLTPKVRYKDQTGPVTASSWQGQHGQQVNREMLENVAALGRADRLQNGNPLDVIKKMPDLVANSKKLSIKGY